MWKKSLLVGWLLFIFYWSGTSSLLVLDPSTWGNTGAYSSNVSILDVLDRENEFYRGYLKPNQKIWELYPEFYIRKLAHIFVYSILALLFLWNLSKTKYKYIISWFFTSFFALSDELHQYLLIGRSGRLIDVILDSSASAIILGIYFVWFFFKNKHKKIKT